LEDYEDRVAGGGVGVVVMVSMWFGRRVPVLQELWCWTLAVHIYIRAHNSAVFQHNVANRKARIACNIRLSWLSIHGEDACFPAPYRSRRTT
jgi:hypothetical protein